MDIVLQDFRGYLNLETKSFNLNWGRRGYRIYPFYQHHQGLGNAYMLKRFGKANQTDYSGAIIVLNYQPND